MYLVFLQSSLYIIYALLSNIFTSTRNQNLTYLENCIDFFENKEKIFLALDNDSPGIKLRNELSRRLGKDRVWLVNFPEGCKDANDVLKLDGGAEVLCKCLDSAKPYPLEGISKASDARKEIHDLFDHGMPKGESIGYKNFDKLMTWRPAEFTLVTGVPGHGKSSFVDQIIVELAIKGWKFGIFSAEKQPIKVHVAELIEKYSKKKFGRGRAENLQKVV